MEKYNKNLGYYYLKQRFEAYYFNKAKLKETDKDFYSVKVMEEESLSELEKDQSLAKLYFSVTNPGMLIGTGTTLEFVDSKEKNSNYKVGIIFDHTSGLPYIPGSSLKGMLRNYFPDSRNEENELNVAKGELINFFLNKDYSLEELVTLKEHIFEGGNEFVGLLPVGKRDKFIEGRVLIKDSETKVLEGDYITPHLNENPNPIKIMKLVPETKIVLLFHLFDCEIGDIKVSKKEKLDLFKNILLLSGLGAKTNTGYGHFDYKLSKELEEEREKKIVKFNEQLEKERKAKEREKLSPIEIWLLEFNEKDREAKNRDYSTAFDGFDKLEDRKIIAKAYLDFFKEDEKPSKKTKGKIADLEAILNS